MAPVVEFSIARYGLVPTVRALYLLALVMMTAKFQILDWMAKETERGKIRMQETAGVSPGPCWVNTARLAGGYPYTPNHGSLGVMVVLNICNS